LEGVNLGVILRRAGAVNAAKKPDDGGRGLQLCQAFGNGARPARPGNGKGLSLRAGGAASRDREDVGLAVEERQQEIAALHVGDAQHPRFVADIEKGCRIERVGIGGRDVAKLASG
jgi:hypothetical protein